MGFEQAEEDQSLRHRRKYTLSRKSKSNKGKKIKNCHSYDSVTEEGLDSHWQDLQKIAVLNTAVLLDLQRFDRAWSLTAGRRERKRRWLKFY